ncbi:MAG: acetolactate synthase small subunit [Verrucomicrobia bacterium]|nr:acetolactate synthase small subunit [Verrucomicrobiota bacterium]
MKHIISVLVQNKFGVLSRVANLFSARGFNIDSLSVGETQDTSTSRMTIVVEGDDRVLEQVTKQLNKLIDVIKVIDFQGGEFVDRELVLIKVNATATTRAEIMQMVDIFRARIVSVREKHFTIEVTGTEDKISAFLDLMRPFGIKELARTGKVAIARA